MQDQVFAKDVVDNLIKADKVTETEYITHYNEDQAIETAKKLIKKHQGTRLEPELRHRIADLYVRQSKTRNFLDQVLKKKGKNFSSEFESVPEKQRILKNAVLELQIVEKNYPKYGKMDEVFYTMGMSYLKLGQVDLAERPFLLLTQRYKNSPLVQDSNLSLAEIYYNQKNYKNSELYFSKIASDMNHNAQSYAIYKKAWTEYYQNQYSSAFQDMKSAYLNSIKKKNGFDISSEVLTDLPLFTAEVVKGDQVFQQLSSFIKNEAQLNTSLDDHARVFAERSDYKDESAILAVLLKRSKSAGQKFEFLSRLAMSNEKMDKLDLTADYYAKAHKLLNQKLEESTKEEFLVFGRNLVKNTYKEWSKADEKAKKRISLKPVLKIGDLAHTTMENSDSQKPKFINILAELNFDINNFAKSSQYFELASDVSNNKTESHELLYSAIVSNEKSVVSDKWTNDQVLRQRHLVQKYDQKYPIGKYGLEVLYKFARVEEKFGKQDLALSTFRRLGAQYPDTVKGKDSQDFVIKIYEKNKDYASVNKYLGEIIPKSKDVSRLSVLKPIYDNSFFLMAETNEKKGRFRSAIMNYKGYLKLSYLKSKLPEASWNIAINYKKAGLKKDAADAYLAFYKANPKSQNSKVALEESLALYEKIRNYSMVENVAWILESITDGNEKIKWSFSLARVNIENKKFKDAETRFYKLVQVSDKKINTDVHQYLFDHVEKIKVGFKDNALRVLQTGQEPFRSEAYIRIALDLLDKDKTVEARAKFTAVLKSPKALAESKAKAAIFIAEMEVKKLSLNRATKPMNFDATLKFIEQTMAKARPVTEDFQNVLTFGHDESSLRALIKLSRLYLDLGMVMSSLVVNDKPDLKLGIEREIRNLKSTLRTSFYESYESSLNIMARNSKLKSKYNSRVRKIRQEFETFYNQNSVAVRGGL
jgi:TolA-binding protein